MSRVHEYGEQFKNTLGMESEYDHQHDGLSVAPAGMGAGAYDANIPCLISDSGSEEIKESDVHEELRDPQPQRDDDGNLTTMGKLRVLENSIVGNIQEGKMQVKQDDEACPKIFNTLEKCI